MQKNRPIAYHGHALKGKYLHLSTYETELLPLATTIKKQRPYLFGKPFIVRTDHQGLKLLLEQRIATPAQQKWLAKLLGYAFIVEYKIGAENKVVDALLRRSNHIPMSGQHKEFPKASCLLLLSVPDPTQLHILRDNYSQDQFMQQLIPSIQAGSAPNGFTWQNNLVFYNGKFFLGPQCPLKSQVLQLDHSNPMAGHSGFLKSYQRAKREFFWHGMKANIKAFVRECDVCQRIKSETSAPASLLQPLNIPTTPWTDVSLGFVKGLPKS